MAALKMEVKAHIKVGTASMVLKEGKVLLGKRKGSHGAGTWGTPGGHLEHGESVEECAARELLEETGLVAKSLQRGPYTSNLILPHHYITLFVFITKVEGTISCLEPHKCEGWQWFDWNDLPKPLLLPLQSFVQEFGFERLHSHFIGT